MAKIYIVGNDDWQSVADRIGGELIPFDGLQMESHEAVHDYLNNKMHDTPSAVIFDMDIHPELSLLCGMHIRLSLDTLGEGALCPIIMASTLSYSFYIKSCTYGCLLGTDKVYFCSPTEVIEIEGHASPLNADDYYSGFLNKVIVNPPANTGRHSLANKWGASVFFKFTGAYEKIEAKYPDFSTLRKHLYYKYIQASTMSLSSLLFRNSVALYGDKYSVSGSHRILLIDDEANSGWSSAIQALFPFCRIDVISEKVSDYSGLSENSRTLIETNDYDLYILDLRMDGVEEDDLHDPSAFSGTKILQKIKSINKGNQVIIFTASNKAWNSKALLGPEYGANGYYIKESPEFKFSDSFSKANFLSFVRDAERCLNNKYLKDLYVFKESVNPTDELTEIIKSQLDIAFNLADIANTAEMYRYAYLAMFQIYETVASSAEVYEYKGKKGIKITRGKNKMAVNVIPDSVNELLNKVITYAAFERNNITLLDRLSVLFLELHENRSDNGCLFLLQQIISVRNALIHMDSEKIQAYSSLPIISEQQFIKKYKDSVPFFSNNKVQKLLQSIAKAGDMRIKDGKIALSVNIADSKVGLELQLELLKEMLNSLI